jgi:hypothetical protein
LGPNNSENAGWKSDHSFVAKRAIPMLSSKAFRIKSFSAFPHEASNCNGSGTTWVWDAPWELVGHAVDDVARDPIEEETRESVEIEAKEPVEEEASELDKETDSEVVEESDSETVEDGGGEGLWATEPTIKNK